MRDSTDPQQSTIATAPSEMLRALRSPDVILDPEERQRFKNQHPGLRRDLDANPFLQMLRCESNPLSFPTLRRSHRDFESKEIDFISFSEFVECLSEKIVEGRSRRWYGSAGGAYPVQAYFQFKPNCIDGIPGGSYYYNPLSHRLIVLPDASDLRSDAHFPTNRHFVARGSFYVFLFVQLENVVPLYGDKALEFSLIEAGLIAQLLETQATCKGIGLCQLGMVESSCVQASLGLSIDNRLLHILIGGPVSSDIEANQVRAACATSNDNDRLAAGVCTRPCGPVEGFDAWLIPEQPKADLSSEGAVQVQLLAIWQNILDSKITDLDEDFFAAGGTSLAAARVYTAIREKLYASIEVTDLFAYPTVRQLSRFIVGTSTSVSREASGTGATESYHTLIDQTRSHRTDWVANMKPKSVIPDGSPDDATQTVQARTPRSSCRRESIAIIGMVGRFPGAPDLDEFWEGLAKGYSAVGPMPQSRMRLIPALCAANPNEYRGSYLDGIELFDPSFFRMSPKEANKVDPAQRILLELSYELFEQAGYMGGQLSGTRAGVFIGACPDQYWQLMPEGVERTELANVIAGNMPAVMANRISHFFDLRGPSLTLDTACSSSLVALDIACQSLISEDCDAALVGSVNLLVYPALFHAFKQDGMESREGKCKTFDAKADGFVRGEGAAALLLKPLAKALADGDFVHAVIRSSATNHTGRTNSLSVPSPTSQRAVITLAHRRAASRVEDVRFVEAHGTGTALGDPIEVRGLTEAFAELTAEHDDDLTRGSPKLAYCAIGSVKTNLGHLEGAAGLAGVVKTVLALKHKYIPPTLNFEEVNPAIQFCRTPFYVNDQLRPIADGRPRLAAVSSFGVGGSNAHVVLEEAPVLRKRERLGERAAQVFSLTAWKWESLTNYAKTFLQFLTVGGSRKNASRDSSDTQFLGDLCFTLNACRRRLPVRLAIVARDEEQLCDRLRLFLASGSLASPFLSYTPTIFFGDSAHVTALSDEMEPDKWLREVLPRLPSASMTNLFACCGGDVWEQRCRPLLEDSSVGTTPGQVSSTQEVEFVSALAGLSVLGVEIDWIAVDAPFERRRVPIPTSPFDRERCWIVDAATTEGTTVSLDRQSLTDRHLPVEIQAPPLPADDDETARSSFHELERAGVPRAMGDQRAAARRLLMDGVSEILELSPERIDPMRPLVEMGMDSMMGLQLITKMEQWSGTQINAAQFFNYPTINALAEFLASITAAYGDEKVPSDERLPEPNPLDSVVDESIRRNPITVRERRRGVSEGSFPIAREPIAIIGMNGRFPQAPTLPEFWNLLRNGRSAIKSVPVERTTNGSNPFRRLEFPPNSVGGFLDNIYDFEPLFFRLSDRQARTMDPQQRILLEVAWELVEGAGYAGGQLSAKKTGVFLGASYNHFRDQGLGEWEELPEAHAALGNHNAILANRLSYFLDLHGPSLVIDTLCSSSLVALHLATESLRRSECDYAIVGGVHVGMSPLYFKALERLNALSKRGMCRTFDKDADGYVPGEGVGAVLLTTLSQARSDHAFIHGLILGSAVNHGGEAAGLTVPNPRAQADVIREALSDSSVVASQITYLETHGTGTALGDPIEIWAASEAFSESSYPLAYCGIGSLKTNVGHLEPCAGIGSLIKVLLAMQHHELPPTLNIDAPNPKIRFEASPFYVNDRLRPWIGGESRPCHAGISAFGLGGANAHVIVREPPAIETSSTPAEERPFHVLALSAKTPAALAALTSSFHRYLTSRERHESGVQLPDICFTANAGRRHFSRRYAVVARDIDHLANHLMTICNSDMFQSRGEFQTEEELSSNAPLKERISHLSPTAAHALIRWSKDLPWIQSICSKQDSPKEYNGAFFANSDLGGAEAWNELLSIVAELYMRGVDIDWQEFDRSYIRRRVPLPTYPFERRRCQSDRKIDTNIQDCVRKDPSYALNDRVVDVSDDGFVSEMLVSFDD